VTSKIRGVTYIDSCPRGFMSKLYGVAFWLNPYLVYNNERIKDMRAIDLDRLQKRICDKILLPTTLEEKRTRVFRALIRRYDSHIV